MKTMIATFILMIAQSASAASPPASFTYQGRLYKANGIDALEAAAVTFKVQIRSPDGLCLLFEETHLRDMSGTSGIFSLVIGEGANTNASPLALKNVFDNMAAKVGAAGCSYTPLAGDTRRLRFTYNDGVETVTLPMDQTVRSVPYAMEAMSLQGLGKDSLIQVSSQTTQANVDSLTAVASNLVALAQGTSNLYTTAADLPRIPGGAFDMTQTGALVADSPATQAHAVNRNYTDVHMGGHAVDLTGLAEGDVLVWSASQNEWAPSSLRPTITETDLPVLATAGRVSGNAIVAGIISGTTAMNTSGAITTTSTVTAQDVVANSVRGRSVQVVDSGNHHVALQTPNALAASYSLTLPATDGNSGQILTTDGSGQLSWSTPSAGATRVGLMDLRNSLNAAQIPTNCAASQTMAYSSVTDALVCSNIVMPALVAADIPSLAWSKITSGLPTSLSGYGITDAVKNAGGIASLQSGLDAAKPAAGTAGRIYFATDSAKVYRDNGSAWVVAATSNEGTVSSVAAGTGLVASTITTTGTLNVDVGTSANKIVQLDASARLPAVDGSQLQNLPMPFSNMSVLEASGNFTVPAGVSRIYVQVWGGGGGGGGGTGIAGIGGSGGGGGGYGAAFLTVTPGSYAVTVGAGGTVGTSNNSGGAGGNSSFASLVSATGGAGGAPSVTTVIAGGTSGALLNVSGGRGHLPPLGNGGTGGNAGGGGGEGGDGAVVSTVAGHDGVIPGGGGGGGGGATLSSSQGGAGARGRVVISW